MKSSLLDVFSKATGLEWSWLSCDSRNPCHALCFTKTAGWKEFFKLFDGSKELFEVSNYFSKRAAKIPYLTSCFPSEPLFWKADGLSVLQWNASSECYVTSVVLGKGQLTYSFVRFHSLSSYSQQFNMYLSNEESLISWMAKKRWIG